MSSDPLIDPTGNGSRRVLTDHERRIGRIEDGEDPGGRARDARLADVEKKLDRLTWAIVALAVVNGIAEFVSFGPPSVGSTSWIVGEFLRILGVG